jgi:endonuclease/exonuclease/phosphatase family metal-dependent hydrolase
MALRTAVLPILLVAVSSALADPPCIDGLFTDWPDTAPIATDPRGDATGAFDLTRVQAITRGTTLHLRFDTGRTLNMQNGPETEGTLIVDLDLPAGKLQIDLRGRNATIDGKRVPLSTLPYVSAPTHAAEEFELMINLAGFGVERGDNVTVQFAGSDSLAQPVSVKLAGAAVEPARRSSKRTPDTDIRIASLNTLEEGLVEPDRADAMGQLLRSVEADVYCFQEENKSTNLVGRLSTLMPGDDTWNVHRRGGCVVASRYPMEPIATDSRRYSAATVRLPVKPPLIVISAHFTCCGYTGSEQDHRRIEETEALLSTIKGIRQGSHGDTPIVVIGDYNLVGSRAPVTMLEESSLRQWLLPHLIGESVVTWRNDGSDFPPGRLDVVTYSPGPLVPRNGFVLDTAELSDDERRRPGVEAGDSVVSDHLMLITDFRLRGPE